MDVEMPVRLWERIDSVDGGARFWIQPIVRLSSN